MGAAAACHEPDPVERVLVLRGRDSIELLGSRFDVLCRETATPVTARRSWLEAWLHTHKTCEPLVVVVERGDRLVAVAPLFVRRRFGIAVVRPLGDGPSDDVRFPAADQPAAERLARGVREALDAVGRPWLLVVRHLGPGQPSVPELARALGHVLVRPGDLSPALALRAERSVRAHLAPGHRKPLERRHRRLREAHDSVVIEHLGTWPAIAACFGEVVRVCRQRELALGRPSQLDQPAFRAFLEQVVRSLSSTGEVELTTVRVDGRLAAYALCFVDGPARRLYHGRYDPRWDRYAVGHLANLAALQRALDDPRCRVFDWMRGTEDYKAPLSDHQVQLTDLIAGSGMSGWLVLRLLPAAIRMRRVARRLLTGDA